MRTTRPSLHVLDKRLKVIITVSLHYYLSAPYFKVKSLVFAATVCLLKVQLPAQNSPSLLSHIIYIRNKKP